MIEIINKGVYLNRGKKILGEADSISVSKVNSILEGEGEKKISDSSLLNPSIAKSNTISYSILEKHNTAPNMDNLKIRFDAMASHDITYVGIVQTARASGLTEFPIPYVLTNCHNSLCAVGGTINEDDHVFGLSAAQKYGGIYVPAHQAVIHQYMREMMAACGKMILGSDSHTRYGALGTMAVGEGGPELAKQLLKKTYDIAYPEVIAVYLKGKPNKGVGPQDVALSIIGAVFKSGFVKNKVLEFVGPGISNLTVDYRNGIDVMTTETTCLSSIWCTDDQVKEYYKIHGRAEAYSKLEPGVIAYYDGAVIVELDKIEPMIAMPFHPSNAYKISEVNENAEEILRHVEAEGQKKLDNPKNAFSLSNKIVNGRIKVDQGIVAGCSGGTFENICEISAMMDKHSVGNDYFTFSVYPASQPIYMELVKNGAALKLMESGAVMKTAFCGPCFGAGDVPANNGLSIRHTTRNFPNREGSKPGAGQISSVALMDARSIAATALNGGILTPATEVDIPAVNEVYSFNKSVYDNRVYNGYGKANKSLELKFGPNITDWPKMSELTENLLLKLVTVIRDEVTTTDELIPSGETSSYRSNPHKLAEFTLSRKDPQYVGKAKEVQEIEKQRSNIANKNGNVTDSLRKTFEIVADNFDDLSVDGLINSTGIGSVIYANKPGDGSAREQAASCQKVLGGWANIALEYATKRYRSNLINWGIVPFTIDKETAESLKEGSYIFVPQINAAIAQGKEFADAYILENQKPRKISLNLANLSKDERDIILSGGLINHYAAH